MRKITSLTQVGKTSSISDILCLLYPPTQRSQPIPLNHPNLSTLEITDVQIELLINASGYGSKVSLPIYHPKLLSYWFGSRVDQFFNG